MLVDASLCTARSLIWLAKLNENIPHDRANLDEEEEDNSKKLYVMKGLKVMKRLNKNKK